MRPQLAPIKVVSHRARSSWRTSGRSTADLCSARLYSGSSFKASGRMSWTCSQQEAARGQSIYQQLYSAGQCTDRRVMHAVC